VAAIVAVVCGAMAAQAADTRRPGIVSHLTLVSDKSEDVSSPEAWKRTYIKDGMTDEEKAVAIWKTITKYRTQDVPPGEGLQDSSEKHPEGNVHEPFKTIHVYGYGMCCCASADIEGLARYIGMPARGRAIEQHSVPEVRYDNAWHLLDASLMFFLRKPGPDGKPGAGPIASVDEMKGDIMAWRSQHPEIKTDNDLRKFAKDGGWQKGPPLFASANLSPEGALYRFYDQDGINRAGWHGWWSNIIEYNYNHGDDPKKMIVCPPDTAPAWNIFDYGATMGYQLNVQLREGEKLTRCWSASQAATGLSRKDPKKFARFLKGDRTVLGMQQDMGDLAPGRVGNGTLSYDALADSQLSADAITFENLTFSGGKLRIQDAAKAGVLVVRMPCSYLYLDGAMTLRPVVGQGGSIRASISLNNGLDWKSLAKFDKSGDEKTDLKSDLFNKYDYRLRIELTGAGTGLDALSFVHAVQHSQAPLPIITAGENQITFDAGPQEGTVTAEGNMNCDTTGGTALSIADFHPTVQGCNMKMFMLTSRHATATVPIATPGDITRLRLGVHWRARGPQDGYDVQASFDCGATWKSIGKLEQANPASSTYLVYTDVPAGKKEVQLKFEGRQRNTTCILDLRIDVDYKEPAGGFRPVKITYVWDEDGHEKTDVHVAKTAPETYTIHCGPKTTAKSFTMELAE
jgi:hypothetical protein